MKSYALYIDRWKLGIDSHDCEMPHIDGLFVKWHITQAKGPLTNAYLTIVTYKLIEQSTSQNLISRFSKDALAFAVDITLERVTLLADDIKRENKLKLTIMFTGRYLSTLLIYAPTPHFQFSFIPVCSQAWQAILLRDHFYNKETIPEKIG